MEFILKTRQQSKKEFSHKWSWTFFFFFLFCCECQVEETISGSLASRTPSWHKITERRGMRGSLGLSDSSWLPFWKEQTGICCRLLRITVSTCSHTGCLILYSEDEVFGPVQNPKGFQGFIRERKKKKKRQRQRPQPSTWDEELNHWSEEDFYLRLWSKSKIWK